MYPQGWIKVEETEEGVLKDFAKSFGGLFQPRVLM